MTVRLSSNLVHRLTELLSLSPTPDFSRIARATAACVSSRLSNICPGAPSTVIQSENPVASKGVGTNCLRSLYCPTGGLLPGNLKKISGSGTSLASYPTVFACFHQSDYHFRAGESTFYFVFPRRSVRCRLAFVSLSKTLPSVNCLGIVFQILSLKALNAPPWQ